MLIHFQGSLHLSKLFLLPTEKGSAVKGKNLPPLESYIFHLSVDPFLEGVYIYNPLLRGAFI